MHRLKSFVRAIVPAGLVHFLENVYRTSRGLFWQARYGFPARGMRVIAVTGTNGKSTTCTYINEVLKAAGYKTAVLSTVFYEIDGQREPNRTHFTISKQSIVQSFLARARRADVDWAIIEVTSHALDQKRLLGVPVKLAVITNLTQDHLDYHGTMENYAVAKARLLSDYGAEHAILNSDDQWHDFFLAKVSPSTSVFTVGSSSTADGRLSKAKITPAGGSIEFKTANDRLLLSTKLLGEFNLFNAAMAAAVGSLLHIKPADITKGIAEVESLAGRMEPVDAGQNFAVLVDFAITPDALEKALTSLRKTTKGPVRIVFGATGDRDKDKRPKMGAVAAKYADFIYLTDDETYTEDPEAIREAVYRGIKDAGGAKKTKIIADRTQAIETAIKEAKRGDVVLLAGIGHETERNMGGQQISWNEKEVARIAITKLNKK